MGLTDWEDVVPGIFIVLSVLGLLGSLSTWIPVLKTIPFLGMISLGVNNIFFVGIAKLLTPFIPLQVAIMSLIVEVIIIVLSIIFIIKVKVL